MTNNKFFQFYFKVYYEDTDAENVVYYANYLKFIERARTEMITDCGLSLKNLYQNHDTRFVVRSCNVNYLISANLEDELEVRTFIKKFYNASFSLIQNIYRNKTKIFESEIILVCINKSNKPTRIPSVIKDKINNLLM